MATLAEYERWKASGKALLPSESLTLARPPATIIETLAPFLVWTTAVALAYLVFRYRARIKESIKAAIVAAIVVAIKIARYFASEASDIARRVRRGLEG